MFKYAAALSFTDVRGLTNAMWYGGSLCVRLCTNFWQDSLFSPLCVWFRQTHINQDVDAFNKMLAPEFVSTIKWVCARSFEVWICTYCQGTCVNYTQIALPSGKADPIPWTDKEFTKVLNLWCLEVKYWSHGVEYACTLLRALLLFRITSNVSNTHHPPHICTLYQAVWIVLQEYFPTGKICRKHLLFSTTRISRVLTY